MRDKMEARHVVYPEKATRGEFDGKQYVSSQGIDWWSSG